MGFFLCRNKVKREKKRLQFHTIKGIVLTFIYKKGCMRYSDAVFLNNNL